MKIPRIPLLSRIPWVETIVPHAGWEMMLMRLFLIWPFWIVARSSMVKVQPKPNGLAHIFDFTWLANPAVQPWLVGVFVVCSLLYVAGRFMPLAVGGILAILICKGTLLNSQGAINHALQLLTLAVLGQWGAYLARYPLGWSRHESHVRAVHWTKIIIAASYVSAAFCKLFASSEFWIARVPYLALQVIKSNLQTYYTDLQTVASPLAERFPYWILENPHQARVFFAAGLLLELFAFMALIGRKWALFIGVSMVLLHYSVQLLMSLEFKHHVYLLLIFYVNAPWWIYLGGKRVVARMKKTAPVAAVT